MMAGKKAIAISHKMGLAVTVIEDGKILRLFPNGNKIIIGNVRARSNKVYTGKMTIK